MANPVLLTSACLLGSLHLLVMLLVEAPFMLALWYTAAVVTSVWNHGSTSLVAKWGDRVIIACALIVDAMYILMLPRPLLLLGFLLASLGVLCYFAAKRAIREGKSGDPYHVASHCIGTALNLLILLNAGLIVAVEVRETA